MSRRRTEAGGGKPRDRKPATIAALLAGERYEVVARAGDEAEQRRLYERLTSEGYACRVITY
jgi:hypothetical protein